MRYLLIIFIISIGVSASAFTLNVNSSVIDSNSNPVVNHWVNIIGFDSVNSILYKDSMMTDSAGNYSFAFNNLLSNQFQFQISTYDCNYGVHYRYVYVPGGSLSPFIICTNISNPCIAQFSILQDSLNPSVYHFINYSTNNFYNEWQVNNIVVSSQVNYTDTFLNNPSLNSVCLFVSNAQQSAFDTSCQNVLIHQCSTTFSDSIDINTVTFSAQSYPVASVYNWDFGDSTTQQTQAPNVTHSYNSAGNHLVILKSQNIFSAANDTCEAIFSKTISTFPPAYLGSIYGYVLADSLYLDYGKIELYQADLLNNRLVLVDSTTIIQDIGQGFTYFLFDQIPYGNYFVKATIKDSSIHMGQFYNTWASNNTNSQPYQWQDADEFNLTSQLLQVTINLKKPDVVLSGGIGSISGFINNNSGINISESTMFLLNANHLLIKGVIPNTLGEFRFDSLIPGIYYVSPELTNMNSIDYQVIITSINLHVDSLVINMDSTHFYVSNEIISKRILQFKLYPNPAETVLYVALNNAGVLTCLVSIMDIYGKKVYENTFLNRTEATLNIPISEFIPGMYVITISDTYNISSKKFIKL